jgi:hypothetical protein
MGISKSGRTTILDQQGIRIQQNGIRFCDAADQKEIYFQGIKNLISLINFE